MTEEMTHLLQNANETILIALLMLISFLGMSFFLGMIFDNHHKKN